MVCWYSLDGVVQGLLQIHKRDNRASAGLVLERTGVAVGDSKNVVVSIRDLRLQLDYGHANLVELESQLAIQRDEAYVEGQNDTPDVLVFFVVGPGCRQGDTAVKHCDESLGGSGCGCQARMGVEGSR
jgi:hypothetical protein